MRIFIGGLVLAVSICAGGTLRAEDKITGGLDKSVIDETILKKLPDIRECYVAELKKSKKSFAGRLAVKFMIGSDGKVTRTSAENSTLGNSAAETCILGVVKSLEFPAPAGGGVVEVDYPFAFTSNPEKADAPAKKEKKRK